MAGKVKQDAFPFGANAITEAIAEPSSPEVSTLFGEPPPNGLVPEKASPPKASLDKPKRLMSDELSCMAKIERMLGKFDPVARMRMLRWLMDTADDELGKIEYVTTAGTVTN